MCSRYTTELKGILVASKRAASAIWRCAVFYNNIAEEEQSVNKR
jgi:hypothetical protein